MPTCGLLTVRIFDISNLICLCIGLVATRKTFSWNVNSALDNNVCQQNLNPYETVSSIACASMCSIVTSCDEFSYSKQHSVCRMCTKSVYTPSRSFSYLAGAATYLLPCSRQWVFFRDSCYFVVPIPLEFNFARLHCKTEAIGGHLVYIETLAEKQFVTNMLDSKYPLGLGTSKIWLGAHDGNTNVFRWMDGTPVNNGFSDWYSREPSNFSYENCLTALSLRDYAWSDDLCDRTHWFVCEVKSQ